MKRNRTFEAVRHNAAQEALLGIKPGVLARKYDITPGTLRNWVKDYQETFGDDALPTLDERANESKRLIELEEKHARALKVLGEKELELEVLRELVKKVNPASMTNCRSPRSSSSRDIL
jgi:transposase-like protein